MNKVRLLNSALYPFVCKVVNMITLRVNKIGGGYLFENQYIFVNKKEQDCDEGT